MYDFDCSGNDSHFLGSYYSRQHLELYIPAHPLCQKSSSSGALYKLVKIHSDTEKGSTRTHTLSLKRAQYNIWALCTAHTFTRTKKPSPQRNSHTHICTTYDMRLNFVIYECCAMPTNFTKSHAVCMLAKEGRGNPHLSKNETENRMVKEHIKWFDRVVFDIVNAHTYNANELHGKCMMCK